MSKLFRKLHPPVGARPGTLVVHDKSPPPRIRVMRYSPEEVELFEDVSVERVKELLDTKAKVWIDVEGLGDESVIRQLGDLFEIHPLALEDVVNVPQRPKAEEFDNHLLLITRLATLDDKSQLEIAQLSLFLGKHFVLSFQDFPSAVLDPIRARVHAGKGPIRRARSDYLAYAIVDVVIDAYYPIVEGLSERIEQLEERVVARPTTHVLQKHNRIRANLLGLRRGIRPQLDTLNQLQKSGSRFISGDVATYLRDVADHCAQLTDVIDSHRDLLSGLLNTYLSMVSHRTNEVMKVLTIMASIFIPLTFMAGIYGMNFDHMPELHSPYAYPMLMAAMALVGLTMLIYFRHRGWIGGDDDGGGDDS